MSLSTALNIANSALFNTARQTSVVSRNVQESGNADYSRRTATLVSTSPGARVAVVQRATDDQLARQNLSAISSWSGQSALSDGLEQLEVSVYGVDNASSAATTIGKLREALQTYSAFPSNGTLAKTALDAAKSVVRSLNDGAGAIQSFRGQADQEIASSVADLNKLLADFKQANDAVVSGTRAGRDTNDALDQRDAVLKKIAEYVPVSTHARADGDIALTTKDGVTLFETVPRNVSFTPTATYGATTAGSVYIDGVPLKTPTGGDTDATGSIAGLLQGRDGVATAMQSQLDEIARGLVSVFAEKANPSGSAPDAAGLFTWSGAPSVPAAGTLVDGLASSISINAKFDNAVGGNPVLMRDGGANGAAYVQNTGGGAGYTKLLLSYSDGLDSRMAFDPSAQAGASLSLSDYSTASVSWFEGIRKSASSASETKEALATRTQEALSNATGVNVDTEMSLLLELEHSYQASARLIKAVDDMMSTLLAAVN